MFHFRVICTLEHKDHSLALSCNYTIIQVSSLNVTFPCFCFHKCLFHFYDCRFCLLSLSQVFLLFSFAFACVAFYSFRFCKCQFHLFLLSQVFPFPSFILMRDLNSLPQHYKGDHQVETLE